MTRFQGGQYSPPHSLVSINGVDNKVPNKINELLYERGGKDQRFVLPAFRSRLCHTAMRVATTMVGETQKAFCDEIVMPSPICYVEMVM